MDDYLVFQNSSEKGNNWEFFGTFGQAHDFTRKTVVSGWKKKKLLNCGLTVIMGLKEKMSLHNKSLSSVPPLDMGGCVFENAFL